jgi:hypothetical protein
VCIYVCAQTKDVSQELMSSVAYFRGSLYKYVIDRHMCAFMCVLRQRM